LLLLLINIYSDWLAPVRAQLAPLTTPFYWLVDTPARIKAWSGKTTLSRVELQSHNEALESEVLVLKRKLQRMASLAAENVRLRQLLNSAEFIEDRVLVAELVGVSPDPLSHIVIINKGSDEGVFIGQPLLDASGLMGQVVEVSANMARVLLITDNSHALPVQVNRNGVRAVAEGVGDLYKLQLRHMANTVDIRVGDLLVSSGLGGRFPVGYPVAVVDSIVRDPGQAFAAIHVRPRAQLDRSRHVLLVFGDRDNNSAQALDNSLDSSLN
jgi:rod shape-determining protein MreC|tara:strand:+ start:1995 stop:2801 length:807 start_codon:yes stop_codon:yes gene_type:complete